jgi:uncharacterized protein (DUF2235 family)
LKKRIITCSDGTWDKPGDAKKGKPLDSNVCLVYQAILQHDDAGVQQVKMYDTGVGTGYSLRDKLLGGATGLGIDRKIKDIYTFIVLNYSQGDEIYLFGFSRGAYTARSLAGLVRNCGILKPEYLQLADRAYELYRDRNDYTRPDSDLMQAFRANYCVEDITPVKFIGVWDTVGSLGIPLPWYKLYNSERYKFHDVTLSSTVENAYHALAVDERRKLFEPTLWEVSKKIVDGSVIGQSMEQRWFPGVHCNIGGGYEDRGLSDQALIWIIEKARALGLAFDPEKLNGFHANCKGVLRDSYTAPYWFWRKIWRQVKAKQFTNEVIDDSVYERINTDATYHPGNMKSLPPPTPRSSVGSWGAKSLYNPL